MQWIDVERDGWNAAVDALQRREDVPDPEIDARVREILDEVRQRGDEALLDLGRRFDAPSLAGLAVTQEEWEQAGASVEERLRVAMDHAAKNIEAFHSQQLRSSWLRHENGSVTGQLLRPLEKVGVYVPGGRAVYASSVLMCAVPARVAGVRDVIMCTPAARDGSVHPAVLYAARLAGVRAVFKVGGAQAIAAMAYGTATIPRVDKVVGPGNAYVCAAKRALWGVVDMDMVAGPSEVCVVADGTAQARFVASDLLTQAEHDPDCAVFLLTCDRYVAEQVQKELSMQLETLMRKEIASQVLARNAAGVITRTLEEALELANVCAPEHLALHVADPMQALGMVRNAGAVMLGAYTPQTVGDYIAGPSHTLPTGGTARFWSPLNVDTFLKKTSFISVDRDALARFAEDLDTFAMAEGFQGHARAVRIRLEDDVEGCDKAEERTQ